jgi:hypothetical protein
MMPPACDTHTYWPSNAVATACVAPVSTVAIIAFVRGSIFRIFAVPQLETHTYWPSKTTSFGVMPPPKLTVAATAFVSAFTFEIVFES